ICSFPSCCLRPGLPSFPTRRSSDLVVAIVVRRSALGLMIESIGINPQASRMAGIKPRGLLVMVYSLSAFLAAIAGVFATASVMRSEEHTSELQSRFDLVCRLLLEKK